MRHSSCDAREAVGRHGAPLLLCELLVEAYPHGRVSLVHGVKEVLEALRRQELPDAPLVQARARAGVRYGRLAHALVDGPRAVRAGRRAHVYELAVAGRRRRDRRHKRLDLVVGKLLGLVVDDRGVRVSSARAPRSRRVLDEAAVLEVYALLAVRASYALHHVADSLVALVLEEAAQALEALGRRLDLVGRVQDLLAAQDHRLELPALAYAVLAVLARHVEDVRGVERRSVVLDRAPGVEHQLLPRVRREAVGAQKLRRVGPVGQGSAPWLYPKTRLLRPGSRGGGRRSRGCRHRLPRPPPR